MASLPSVQPRSAGSMRQVPSISAVIVNYCRWRATAALTRGLLKAAAVEVVVVDNDSPRHPLIGRLRRHPVVGLRRWRRNPGFAAAVNEGVRLSQAPWLLILNPDISLPPGFASHVQTLAKHLERTAPRAGIVGFRLRHGDGSPQLSSGRFPTLAHTLLGLLRPRDRRKYQILRTDRRQPVDWVTGCCLLVRRECLQQVGGFDPSFFLYYEDVDLCRRARAAGWSVWFEPRLTAVHHRPLHSRPVTPLWRFLTRHGLLTYAGKHWPRWQLQLLRGIIRLEAWFRRRVARGRGDAAAVWLATETANLADEAARGDTAAVRRHLRRVLRRFGSGLRPPSEDSNRAAFHHHPQPQPAGPAGSVPAERVPVRPG